MKHLVGMVCRVIGVGHLVEDGYPGSKEIVDVRVY
jgi:hypothetical protein